MGQSVLMASRIIILFEGNTLCLKVASEHPHFIWWNIPDRMVGKSLNGIVHIGGLVWNFMLTCGVDPHDTNAENGLPKVDSVNMWPY